ncbi:MAG: TRAP transporter permease, partial [Alphaproteobacteria bacterium]|nr:TRAP transporter permease [Alphaproteobacteria bacterium]
MHAYAYHHTPSNLHRPEIDVCEAGAQLTVYLLIFLALLLLNMPIAFAIGIPASLYFIVEPSLMFPIAVQRMIAGTQSFPLLAVPFFILAGHLT